MPKIANSIVLGPMYAIAESAADLILSGAQAF